ncbi:hypothetical protein Tco_0540904 [Tanacetum coccineum]
MPTEMELTLEQTQQGVSYEVSSEFMHNEDGILLEPNNKQAHGSMVYLSLRIRSIKVKEFQRSFRHSDTERLSRSDEVLKLKNFKKDATLKLSKSTNQEWYEHVGPEVTRSQDDKVTRWQNEIILG